MYPNIDDLLPDPASMRASGAQDATDFFRDVWGDTPISWRVPPNTLRSLREGFRNGDVAELVSRDCRDESNDVYDDDDVAEMLDRTKPPLRHTLSLLFCYAPGAHALRNSVLRMAYNAPELAERARLGSDATRHLPRPFFKRRRFQLFFYHRFTVKANYESMTPDASRGANERRTPAQSFRCRGQSAARHRASQYHASPHRAQGTNEGEDPFLGVARKYVSSSTTFVTFARRAPFAKTPIVALASRLRHSPSLLQR